MPVTAMRLNADARGVFVIAPTPFDDNGAVDESSIDRLADSYAPAGATGITALGIMGEAPKLETAESLAVARRFITRANGLPVVIGVSAPGFAGIRSLAHAVMDMGAAGVMIAPPSHLRSDDQIVGYFRQAVAAIGEDIPFVLQDYPLVVGVTMTAGVIRRIVADNPSCVMLKHEDWPGLDKISALRGFSDEGSMRRISILCGNGALFLDFEMERGADGAMTGYAFPEMLSGVVARMVAGDRDGAHDLFDAHLPLVRYEQQPGIGLAVRKHILRRRGLLASDAQRVPASRLSASGVAEIEYLLGRLRARDPVVAAAIRP